MHLHGYAEQKHRRGEDWRLLSGQFFGAVFGGSTQHVLLVRLRRTGLAQEGENECGTIIVTTHGYKVGPRATPAQRRDAALQGRIRYR